MRRLIQYRSAMVLFLLGAVVFATGLISAAVSAAPLRESLRASREALERADRVSVLVAVDPPQLPKPYLQLVTDTTRPAYGDEDLRPAGVDADWAYYRPRPLAVHIGVENVRAIVLNSPERPVVRESEKGYELQWDWTGKADRPNADADWLLGFVLQRRRMDGGDWKPIAVLNPEARSYVDTRDNLIAEVRYEYRLAATGKTLGESGWVTFNPPPISDGLAWSFESLLRFPGGNQALITVQSKKGGGIWNKSPYSFGEGDEIVVFLEDENGRRGERRSLGYVLAAIGKREVERMKEVERTVLVGGVLVIRKVLEPYTVEINVITLYHRESKKSVEVVLDADKETLR